jgi:trk system potassium uptake protein TrkA
MNLLIVGGGTLGATLAARLHAAQHHVKLIELSHERFDALGRDLPAEALVLGSGSEPGVLEAADIRQAEVVLALTGADETNLVITSLARFEFGVPHTIARVNNPKNAWLFTAEMGVDMALDQVDLIARMIIDELRLPCVGT